MTIVLDASITVSWAFEEEGGGTAMRLLSRLTGETALSPPIWPLEVTNALLTAERRSRISPSEVQRFLRLLAALEIEIDRQTLPRASGDVIGFARLYGLTTYDASYLELALRTGSPLATLDRALANAAQAAGVPLVE